MKLGNNEFIVNKSFGNWKENVALVRTID